LIVFHASGSTSTFIGTVPTAAEGSEQERHT